MAYHEPTPAQILDRRHREKRCFICGLKAHFLTAKVGLCKTHKEVLE